MFVICDTETERLENPEKIWVIVCRELNGVVHVFERPDRYPTEFNEFARAVTCWIGHNFISFDNPVIHSLIKYKLNPISIIDTLVVSKLLNYGIEGGHSLEAWGNRLGCKKTGLDLDFSVFSKDIIDRCIQDTEINLKLYNHFSKYILSERWKSSLRTEHNLQIICKELEDNGFPFDYSSSVSLLNSLLGNLRTLDEELKKGFPPKSNLLREVSPKLTMKGTLDRKDFRGETDLTKYTGGPFSRFEYSEFNPGSVKQIVERMNEAGWKPTDKTKGHIDALKRGSGVSKERLQSYAQTGYRISEENLRTLPESAPASAKKLVERLLIASRVSDLEEWQGLARRTPPTGTQMHEVREEGGVLSPSPSERFAATSVIHGRFNGIGAWTQRMSHHKPNMANIPVAKRSDSDTDLERRVNDINDSMRQLWVARPGYRLVGVDADGIQMRVFAHYVNDPKLIEALIKGKKEDESDIHSVNRRVLGVSCRSRDDAKTFLYAWLLGAGVGKVSEILQCSLNGAKEAISSFIAYYPGLRELREKRIPSDAARGYFEGLDKRLVLQYNEHLMLAGYLQNGEKVIMARACNEWHERLRKEKIPFIFRNFVHDEWQTETTDDDDVAKLVADTQVQSIVNQAEQLSLNCPLAANYRFGYTWKETH